LLYIANFIEVPFLLRKNGVDILASIYTYRKTAVSHLAAARWDTHDITLSGKML